MGCDESRITNGGRFTNIEEYFNRPLRIKYLVRDVIIINKGRNVLPIIQRSNYHDRFEHFLSEKGKVYCSGENIHGELGIGKRVEYISKNEPVMVKNFAEKSIRIIKIAQGKRFTLFLSYSGTVYGCGDNRYGQLGLGRKKEVKMIPRIIKGLIGLVIVDIKVGKNHSLFLEKKGNVYVCGDNRYGQLGLNKSEENVILPVLCKKLESIRKMDACDNYSLFLDRTGQVWSCGSNKYGNLGLKSNKQKIYHPQLLKRLKNIRIVDIKAGLRHIVLLDRKGLAYTAGNNDCLQLGRNDKNTNCISLVEKLAKLNQRLIQVRVGSFSSYFITNEGDIWVCGANSNGSLGNGFFTQRSGLSKISKQVMGNRSRLIEVWTYKGIDHHRLSNRNVQIFAANNKVFKTGKGICIPELKIDYNVDNSFYAQRITEKRRRENQNENENDENQLERIPERINRRIDRPLSFSLSIE